MKSVTVLDVGCGLGALRDYLHNDSVQQYTGIDFSPAALASAWHNGVDSVFDCVDATTYTPECRFNVIVFNEILYCFQDPIGVLQRYASFLEQDGIFVISMYCHGQKPEEAEIISGIWRRVDALSWHTLDESVVADRSGADSWRIRALRPGSRPS